MPMDLDQTYERILDSIQDSYFKEVRAALSWLAFSTKPLTVAELAEACSIRYNVDDDDTKPSLEEGELDALVGLFDVMSSIILVGNPTSDDPLHAFDQPKIENKVRGGEPLPKKYDPSCYTQKVRLAHFSVKEYLVSSRLQLSHPRLSRYAFKDMDAHWLLSQNCCAYLLWFLNLPELKIWIDEERDVIMKKIPRINARRTLTDFTPAYPLLSHACLQWVKHQTLAENGANRFLTYGNLHVKILGDKRTRFAWLRLVADTHADINTESRIDIATAVERWAVTDNWDDGYDGTKALYWASVIGLKHTALFLGDRASQQEVCNTGGDFHTALHATAYLGYETIMDMLVAKGADVNCMAHVLGTPLQAAARNGNEKLVNTLIANGADVNLIGGDYSTAIVAAAYHGYHEVVSKLLEANISTETLNFRAARTGSALEAAARNGHVEILQMLLGAGATHGKAILEAMKNGHENIVRILIDRGADLNVRFSTCSDHDFRPAQPKPYAGRIGDCTISVLELAVATGSDEIVNKLLQAGADANSWARDVLSNAIQRKDGKKFKMLIEAGAKIQPSYDDVLTQAIEADFATELVEIIVQAGVRALPGQLETATYPSIQRASGVLFAGAT
jgi:ankyrin repeat protein